jgi:sugar phosphate isomerase/epimerase
MITIPVKVSEELAERLAPFEDHLDQIIELGLKYWQGLPEADLTPRQRIEQLLRDTGLIVPLDPAIACRYTSVSYKRQPALHAGGKPASQIIIEQPGTL